METIKIFYELSAGQEKILELITGMQENASKFKPVYTIEDLAEMFQVSTRTIYNWREQGLISFIQIGSKTYMTSEQVNEFLVRHEVKSAKSRRTL